MSSRGSIALMPRTRRGLVLFWTALFMLSIGLQYAAAAMPKAALAGDDCVAFAIFTTDPNGDPVNQNHYASKSQVFLNGGPASGDDDIPAGTTFYYQVQEPDGDPLMEIRSVLTDADGTFQVGLAPFDTTSNNGGEYKVVVSTHSDLKPGGCTKSDNFKVDDPGSLRITKDISGGPGEISGSFDITVDCGDAGTFHETIEFPDPGEVTIEGIDAGAECTVDEDIIQEDPPLGYHWGPPSFVGNPATIVSGQTVTIEVTNTLELKPGHIRINKLVEGGPEGFTGSFDITVDCGDQEFSGTIEFPNPGFLEFAGVDLDAECTVTEESMSAAPEGFQWGDVTYDNNPATVPGGQITEVDVINHLELIPDLDLTKSNDAPDAGGLPTAEEGDTVTYTIDYSYIGEPVGGTLTDVLPVGVTYVDGSAADSANGEFVFDGYDAATRTLTWVASEVTEGGSVSYEATVDEGATELQQPLVNSACIVVDREDLDEVCDTSDVFVPPPPQAETAPPTDIDGTTGTGAPGSMLLVLLALAGIALAVTFIAPTPASIRRRNNR